MQEIKEYIANGQAVAFSRYVLCGYGMNLPMQDGVISETSCVIGQTASQRATVNSSLARA